MSEYRAPLKDIRFTLNQICDLPQVYDLPGMEAADAEVVDAALEEAGRLAAEVLGPLNKTGDEVGAVLENGVVRTPDGFRQAYTMYQEAGWNSLQFPENIGGMGLPSAVGNVCCEFWNSANMGFALCPLLTMGAIDALEAHGSEALKETYLRKLVSGEWTGTMNLTEPQAGSDVGALRTKAEPAGDGAWRISGQKIFITYGDHDFTDNIIHLVLARTPDAPAGTKGISLFVVPKVLVNDDGELGERNDVRCVSLEEKLGIHASPTAVLSFGDNGGAVGYLVGEENQGMRCMFTMMNAARLAVGVQGMAIAERAYQRAAAFANERRQGRALGATEPGSSAIVEHADVRRMLMTMKGYVDASRAICYANAVALDHSRHNPDDDARQKARALVELLTPISKGWSTEIGCEVASIGVQVHGGMGFIEETGAAQYYRDARITPIYEGTNGIQAMDLVMRKLPMEGGAVVRGLFEDMRALDEALAAAGEELAAMRAGLLAAIDACERAADWMLKQMATDTNDVAAGCVPFLRMMGLTLGGFYLAKGAVAALALKDEPDADQRFLDGRIATARFFCEQLMPGALALLPSATAGAAPLYRIDAADLSQH
jgi:alkylation response protein AidB-like acyl-CoA dehydrogenase